MNVDQAIPDDADIASILAAYLQAHAQGAPVPAALFAKGESVYRRFEHQPPPTADWGRFLVAQGELAAEHLHDAGAASRYFLEALQSVRTHGDNEVGITAGFNQGVLHERQGNRARALIAYRTAAEEGFRLHAVNVATLRAALAAIRLDWEARGMLDPTMTTLLKKTWLTWLWLRQHGDAPVPNDVSAAAAKTLAAFLLPEDDPTQLIERWSAWSPKTLATPLGTWRDDDTLCIEQLLSAAVAAADEYLRDESPDPAAPYREMREARSQRPEG